MTDKFVKILLSSALFAFKKSILIKITGIITNSEDTE